MVTHDKLKHIGHCLDLPQPSGVFKTCGGLLFFVELGQVLLEIHELGHVVVDDVRLVRVIHQVVLMIGFRLIESFEWTYLCRDLVGKDFCLV